MAIERTFSIIKPNAVAKKRYWQHLLSLRSGWFQNRWHQNAAPDR